jgi:PAS domain S-box-containing protein
MTLMSDAKLQQILLVEDNLVDARLMQMLLSKPDIGLFELHQVGRLQAALEALAQRRFAAILLDLILPDGEGLEIVQRVHHASPKTPIVVLTNLVNETLTMQAMQAGAQDYLFKSEVNSRSLARALHYAIERQALVLELQKQTEALQTNEIRLRTLLDATPDIVCFKDGTGHWLEANAACLKLFQLDGVDYRGRTDAELAALSPFYRNVFLANAAADEQAWQRGVMGMNEESIPMPAGASRTYEVIKVPLFFADGQRKGLVVLGRNITDHKETEQSLARERDLLQSLMDNIPDTIYFKDAASRFVRINQAQAQLLELADSRAATGKTDLDFFSSDFAQAAYADEQAILTSGVPQIGKVEEVRRPDGLRRWVSATKMPIRDAAGEVVGLVGISRDITEIKQREHELEVIAQVSAALRSATNRAEMRPLILQQVLSLLEAETACLTMVDPATGEMRVELAYGVWSSRQGAPVALDNTIGGEVLQKAQPYWTNTAYLDPRLAATGANETLRAMVCVPLVTQEHSVGVLWVGRQADITEVEVRLLNSVGNIAASAIHRVTLHEQTEKQLHYLAALRTIDAAISGSIDLRLTLRVLLDQVTAQLRVHAADILLLDSRSQTLHYAEGRGFLSAAQRDMRLHMGRGHAGRAALERRVISISNLAEAPDDFARGRLLAGEKFVAYYAAPLIAKGQVKGILEVFHRAPLAAEADWLDFLETLASQAAIAIDNASMFEEQQRSNVELRHTNIELNLALDAVIEKWAQAIDEHCQEAGAAAWQAVELAVAVGRRLGLSEMDLTHLRRGALLHDVGELALPQSILLKPAALTEPELELVRGHPGRAEELLAPVALLRPALEIPSAHHERWDGSGYPRHLQGEHIPLAARIFAVADVWQALQSTRPFRPAWPAENCEAYLREQAGRQFDPRVVDEFLRVLQSEGKAA